MEEELEKAFLLFFYLSVYNGRSLRHNAVLDEPVLDLNAEKQVAKRIVNVCFTSDLDVM